MYSAIDKLLRISLIAIIILSTQAFAKSPVWKVSKGDKYLYIGGTFHLLKPSDHPLPKAFDTAYQEASRLVFETDIEQLGSAQVQSKMIQAFTYQDDTTLEKVLSPEVYQRLSAHLATHNIPITAFAKSKPSIVSITIAIMELQRLGFTPDAGVDIFYSKKARRDQKPQLELETIDEQIQFLSIMGEGREDAFMKKTLDEVSTMQTSIEDLRTAWITGNKKKMDKIGIRPMRKEYPEVYNILLHQRNNAWMPKLEALIADDGVEFVLVGALHLPGKHGLLRQLKKKGYKIKNL
ncbi:MAG: TraB/GumN family protein [Alteromonadaceae bacterium]|nr:MAG: TraB/GumN family protein [Alteromonadaceae bacterium]